MAVAEREIITTKQAEAGVSAFKDSMPHLFRWTRDQFHQMREARLFDGQRVILIEGEILVMPPIGNLHRGIVTLASAVLRDVFGPSVFVSEEKPFGIGNATDPLPDIAVVAGSMRNFIYQSITEAALIVEVSDSTLAYDRSRKAGLYAKAGVQDYWIINLAQAPPQIEIYRRPQPDESQHYGFGYGESTIHQSGEIVQPLSGPGPVAVSALLP